MFNNAILFTDNIAKLGLYVNGEDALSIYNWFDIVDAVLLYVMKNVPFWLSFIPNATLLAIFAVPEKLVQFKVDVYGS